MSGKRLHLVRHGEVDNPEGVLYGRLPGYELSPLGHRMAEAAAETLSAAGRPVSALIASPLERAQQSARPISRAFDLEIAMDERIIEPSNDFEGQVKSGRGSAMLNPRYWYRYRNPFRPSWGEPYRSIVSRTRAAMDAAWDAADGEGDIVMVSHQAVIWLAHLDIAGKALFHNPARRRCELSSITSFERREDGWVEVDYRTPAAGLMAGSVDVGAV
ncbi:MAG: histidine phosphatase family protein [Leucobacter sp.]